MRIAVPLVIFRWPALVVGSFGAASGAQKREKDTGCSETGEPGDRPPSIQGSCGLSVSMGASGALLSHRVTGPVRRGISAEVLDVSLPSTLELLGFARCVVGVVRVLSFRHLLFLDRRGVWPPGVIGFCALNHLAWLGGRVQDSRRSRSS